MIVILLNVTQVFIYPLIVKIIVNSEINLVQQRKIIHEIKTVENIVKDYIDKSNSKITKYSSLLTSILNKEFSYE